MRLAPHSTHLKGGLTVAEYRLIQDGQLVVKVVASDDDALREIRHYAAVYSQDGPVKIQFKTRGGRWANMNHKEP